MHQDWILPRWGSSPHTRGARQSARHGVAPRGSSPHARGALIRRVSIMSAAGIIPACAGSTSTCIRESATAGDHPRMRGEHFRPSKVVAAVPGSSPHARGALHPCPISCQSDRIIPACAGSTNYALSSQLSDWDHPRMRGEHCVGGRCMWAIKGSSPHARGAQHHQKAALGLYGIIPACAGSTILDLMVQETSGDHPRMRGEHSCRCTA